MCMARKPGLLATRPGMTSKSRSSRRAWTSWGWRLATSNSSYRHGRNRSLERMRLMTLWNSLVTARGREEEEKTGEKRKGRRRMPGTYFLLQERSSRFQVASSVAPCSGSTASTAAGRDAVRGRLMGVQFASPVTMKRRRSWGRPTIATMTFVSCLVVVVGLRDRSCTPSSGGCS